MKNGKRPDPDVIHPVEGYEKEIYVKPCIKNPNIEVGEFTYIADSDFESHVTHHYPWIGDRLVIGKFCQIGAGVEFVMNGANHQMNSVSTFPFYTLEGWNMNLPAENDLPLKGDTVIGNDVWIGQNAVILPGVRIGDGAVIGTDSVVGSDVDPYTIVAGNPAKPIRKRFDEELIMLMQEWKWWDKSIDEIDELIPLLTNSNLYEVKRKITVELCERWRAQGSKTVDPDLLITDPVYGVLWSNMAEEGKKNNWANWSVINPAISDEAFHEWYLLKEGADIQKAVEDAADFNPHFTSYEDISVRIPDESVLPQNKTDRERLMRFCASHNVTLITAGMNDHNFHNINENLDYYLYWDEAIGSWDVLTLYKRPLE